MTVCDSHVLVSSKWLEECFTQTTLSSGMVSWFKKHEDLSKAWTCVDHGNFLKTEYFGFHKQCMVHWCVFFWSKVPKPLGEWAGHCSCKVTETVFLSSNPAQIQSLGSRCKYVQVRPWEKPFTFQVAEAWICCGFVGKPKDEKLGQSQISQCLYSLQWWPSCIKRRQNVHNLW